MTDLDPVCMQKFTKKMCPTTEQMLKVSMYLLHVMFNFSVIGCIALHICDALCEHLNKMLQVLATVVEKKSSHSVCV